MDAKMQGCTKREPNMELKRKLGDGYTEVVAIELKNPNGCNWTSPEQDVMYVRSCNVATLVTSDYDEIVIVLHEHYKNTQHEHTRMLAIRDEPQPQTSISQQTKIQSTGATNLKPHRVARRVR